MSVLRRYSTPPWSETALASPYFAISLKNLIAWMKFDLPDAFDPITTVKLPGSTSRFLKLLKFLTVSLRIGMWEV